MVSISITKLGPSWSSEGKRTVRGSSSAGTHFPFPAESDIILWDGFLCGMSISHPEVTLYTYKCYWCFLRFEKGLAKGFVAP